jgi:hypothetical protein
LSPASRESLQRGAERQPATATHPTNQPIIKPKRAASLGPLSRDGCVVGRGRQRLPPPPRCWKIDQRRPPAPTREKRRATFVLVGRARDSLFFSLAAHLSLSLATTTRILQPHSRTQTQTQQTKNLIFDTPPKTQKYVFILFFCLLIYKLKTGVKS